MWSVLVENLWIGGALGGLSALGVAIIGWRVTSVGDQRKRQHEDRLRQLGGA